MAALSRRGSAGTTGAIITQEARFALEERLVRRVCAVVGDSAVLGCIADEIHPWLQQPLAWICELDRGREALRVSASWPGDTAWSVLPPGMAVVGAGRPDAYQSPDGCGQDQPGPDAYERALRELGIHTHMTLRLRGVDGAERLVSVGHHDAAAWCEGHAALMATLEPTIAEAFAPPFCAAEAGARATWTGLDAVELLDYVCGSVAHDVRNIMAGMVGAAQLHRSGGSPDGALDAVQRRALEGLGMAEAMREQLRRLVSVGSARFDLAKAAQDVCRLAGPSAAGAPGGARRVRCEAEPLLVDANPGEVKRAVSAMVFNAIRATPPGDEVEVRVEERKRWACVVVVDCGEGISGDTHRRAKEPFFTTGAPDHCGLGLTIAEGVARRFGGSLTLQPREHGGTRVRLSLPRSD